MRRHPRLFQILKHGGLVLSLLIAAVWITSLWRSLDYLRRSRTGFIEARIGYGSFYLMSAGRPSSVGVEVGAEWSIDCCSEPPIWMPRLVKGGLMIPLWIPFLLVGIPTGVLFWRDRRRIPPGHCRCGYDLTGNTSGVCPECGEKVLYASGSDT